MKPTDVSYEIWLYMQFSMNEINLLVNSARNHYDAVCREAASQRLTNGRIGLVAGCRNAMVNFGEDVTHRLCFKDLDTMAKILEQPASMSEDRDTALRRSDLHAAIFTLLRDWGDIHLGLLKSAFSAGFRIGYHNGADAGVAHQQGCSGGYPNTSDGAWEQDVAWRLTAQSDKLDPTDPNGWDQVNP